MGKPERQRALQWKGGGEWRGGDVRCLRRAQCTIEMIEAVRAAAKEEKKLPRARFRCSTMKNTLDAAMSVSPAANGGRLWEGEGFGVVYYWADRREGMSGIIARASDMSGGWVLLVKVSSPFPMSPPNRSNWAHSAMPGQKY